MGMKAVTVESTVMTTMIWILNLHLAVPHLAVLVEIGVLTLMELSLLVIVKLLMTGLPQRDLLEGGAKGLIDCLIMKLRKKLSKRRKKSLEKICNMIFLDDNIPGRLHRSFISLFCCLSQNVQQYKKYYHTK